MPDLTDAWDDIDPETSLSSRMARLELMMRAFRDSDVASTYLTDSVARLDLNASALNEALHSVDETLQATSQLGRELDQVRTDAATKAELEAASKKAKRQRRLYAAAGVLLIALPLFSYSLSVGESAHDACEKRQIATGANVTVLENFLARTPDDPILVQGIATLRSTLTESCDDQYRLRLP